MKRKILLPTDFSNNAWNAINYAINLFESDICDFYILNAFSADFNPVKELINLGTSKSVLDNLQQESENKLNAIVNKIRDHKINVKHDFKIIAINNNPVNAITNIVEQKDIELIVMGSQGVTRSQKVAFGSNSIYVMEKVRNCPSIIVPENTVCKLPKEIVFPTSFKTHYKIKELKYIIEIAKKANASISILHIRNEEEDLTQVQIENKALLEEYFLNVKHTFHYLYSTNIEFAINIFIQSRNSDMIAFINKKHSFFGSVFTQPLVKELGFYSKIPILALHDLRN